MISGGAGYVYDTSITIAVPRKELVTTIQRYLDRLGDPDLTLAQLREFH